MEKLRLAIAGIGNCASSLVQGIYYYQNQDNKGFSNSYFCDDIAGIKLSDIDIVAAFDIDKRKVGKPLTEAIFTEPNCTKKFIQRLPKVKTIVQMGPVLDGIAPHMSQYSNKVAFRCSRKTQVDVSQILIERNVDVLVNFLPVGSEKAVAYYANTCLLTNTALVNCQPVFIASNPLWARKFKEAKIPLIGDDIKSQFGATILHRSLAHLFDQRGIKLLKTYQLNTGGNTDFLNMLDQYRLSSKKISKTNAVQSILKDPLPDENIHIGPSAYVEWQKDNKVCFIRMIGAGFGENEIELELRLSVQDSPNSTAPVLNSIRIAKFAKNKNIGGALEAASACYMKSPPKQMDDAYAKKQLDIFLRN